MDPLLNPATVMLMNAAPAQAIQRLDFTYQTGPNFTPNCRMYHMPGREIPVDPGPAPVAPTALPLRGLGRPSATRLQQEEQCNIALAAHEAALAAHVEAQRAYLAYMAGAPLGQVDGLPDPLPDPELIFTHGRGSTLDNEAVVAFAEGYARTKNIMLFEDTGDLTHRTATFRSLMNNFPTATVIGGRSMGARASARAQIYSPVHKLIFFTYPLVRGMDERYDELLALEANTDVIFVLGDADPLCHEMHLKAIRSRVRARTWWLRLVAGDHALWYEGAQRDAMCNVAGQISAWWSDEANRDPALTELTLDYNRETQRATWTGWMSPRPEAPLPNTRFNISVSGWHLPGGGGSFSFNL